MRTFGNLSMLCFEVAYVWIAWWNFPEHLRVLFWLCPLTITVLVIDSRIAWETEREQREAGGPR